MSAFGAADKPLPPVCDAAHASRTLGALAERGFAPAPQHLPLLAAAFGNSPHLARLALRDIAFLQALLDRGTAALLPEICGEASAAENAASAEAAMATLRVGKRRASLAIALADISGAWTLDEVTAALTHFADVCVGSALRFLLAKMAAQAAGPFRFAEGLEANTGLVVLAMGKYGAHELNYSSDIDLIVFYETERFPFQKRGDARAAAVDFAKGLVKLLSEVTADGYVFRVDLRLRPDAGATQIAISTEAAEAYYEGMGQNWERAALIKARACAGDREAAARLLKNIEPFVWRRSLDYAAIEDIHSIKRQIHAHAGHEKLSVAGHNIKLGRGGIREIEFFVQTQQLILGGRDPNLRVPSTLGAMERLRKRGLVSEQTASALSEAYVFLRTLEHRLQMIDDEQTHTVPTSGEGLARIAGFMGFDRVAAFSQAVLVRLETVQRHYARLFDQAPPLASSRGNLVFTGVEDDPETLSTLRTLGFLDAHHVAHAIRGWHHGRIRATRGARARELLTKLVPALLDALASAADPDSAFAQFDRLLSRLPAGVQLFSMLLANPHLLKLLADICGAAPRFASRLGHSPGLLDAVLDMAFLTDLPDYAMFSNSPPAQLDQVTSYERKLDAARRFAGEQMFRVAVHMLEGKAPGERTAEAFTGIAEAVIRGLWAAAEEQFARTFGKIARGAFAVIALGRLGGREMTAGSDLDLVFVYDAPLGVDHSDGAKPLPISAYYVRLAQRLIAALTVQTAEGGLYEVDMRLRPTGNKGPVAVSLEAFDRYHSSEAWTWERMALTRARVLSSPGPLASQIGEVIRRTLTAPTSGDTLKRDAREMRQVLAANFAPTSHWDLKFAPGGLVDIEFVAQYLQLREARENPAVLDVSTVAALEKLRDGAVLDRIASTTLIEAARLQQNLLQILRIAVDGPFDAAEASRGLRGLLAQVAGEKDFGTLDARLRAAQSAARGVFEKQLLD